MIRRTEKDIKKLAGVEEEYGTRLGPAKKRKPRGTSRGIAYATPGGIQTKEGASPDDGVPGNEDPIEDQDGNGGDNDSGGTEPPIKTPGDKDETPIDQVPDDAIGDQVEVITGNDYSPGFDDGQVKVDVNAPPGFGYDVPPGWDDPDTPTGSEDGKSWVTPYVSNKYFSTGNAAGNAAVDSLGWTDTTITTNNTGGVASGSWFGSISFDKQAKFSGKNEFGNPVNNFTIGYRIDTPQGETNEPDLHPADGFCRLAWDEDTGKFKGHDADPDCTAAQKAGHANLYVESNSVRKRITRLANGGFKIVDVDSGNLTDPNGYTRIYTPDGILIDIYPNSVQDQIL